MMVTLRYFPRYLFGKRIKSSIFFFITFKKIWDLRAGRLLSELREHTAAVTEVVFHPHEFLLASGAADRRVLFWDLENFTLVSNSDPETSGIRYVQCFNYFDSPIY